jgi:hypothetical protein
MPSSKQDPTSALHCLFPFLTVGPRKSFCYSRWGQRMTKGSYNRLDSHECRCDNSISKRCCNTITAMRYTSLYLPATWYGCVRLGQLRLHEKNQAAGHHISPPEAPPTGSQPEIALNLLLRSCPFPPPANAPAAPCSLFVSRVLVHRSSVAAELLCNTFQPSLLLLQTRPLPPGCGLRSHLLVRRLLSASHQLRIEHLRHLSCTPRSSQTPNRMLLHWLIRLMLRLLCHLPTKL